MANTIYSLFPYSPAVIEKAVTYPCKVEFSASIDDGKYVFNGKPKKFGKLPMGQTGVIAGVMISANCSPDSFAAAVDDPLGLRVYHGQNKTPINMSPFYFSQFSHGDNFTVNWRVTGLTRGYSDDFLIGISGKVNQIDDMDENELRLKILFNFIRVDNKIIDKLADQNIRVESVITEQVQKQ